MNAQTRITIGAALPLVAALLLIASWPGGAGAEEDHPGWLGVSLQQLTPSLREAMDISSDAGVLITEVAEDSPAEKAGLKMGDVILEYDGQMVSSPRRLSRLVRGTEPDTEVDIRVLRKGQEKNVQAKLGEGEPGERYRFRIRGDDDEGREDLLMDIDKDALLLGMPPYPGLMIDQGLWLGIEPIGLTEQLAKYFRVTDGLGVLIGSVFEDSPAEKAGLRAGDIIVNLDGERIENAMELREEIKDHEAGDEVTVTAIRDGKGKKFQATLEESDLSERLPATKKLEKWPFGKGNFHLRTPSKDPVDIYLEKELAEEDLEKLEGRLDELEEQLDKLQKSIDKLQE